jgi:hypothetical protein
MANELLHTSATFLLDSNQPTSSSSTLPPLNLIPPETPSRRPRTSTTTKPLEYHRFECHRFEEDGQGDVKLLGRISELEIENQMLRRDIRSLHSHLALTTIFCEQLRTSSEATKEKAASKKGRKRLKTTKGALLTGNEFMMEVEDHTKARQRKADDKVDKARKMADYKQAKEVWDVTNKARIAKNNALRGKLKEAVNRWELEGRQGAKPKQTGVLNTKALPKPEHPFPKCKANGKEKDLISGEPMQVDDGEESNGESNASSVESDDD